MAGLLIGGATAIGVAVSGDSDPLSRGYAQLAAVIFGVPGLTYAFSSAYGFSVTGECRSYMAGPGAREPPPPTEADTLRDELHRSATSGDCATVRMMVARVEHLRAQLASDPAINACLSAAPAN